MAMGLLKKYRHCTNPTACAVEFTKTVGADLYIRPYPCSLRCGAGQWKCRLTYWLNRRLYSAPTIFINSMTQRILHDVTPFVQLQQTAVLFFNSPK